VKEFDVSDELRSDHLAIIIELESSLPSRSTQNTISIKTTNWDIFKTALIEEPTQPNQLSTTQEVDKAVDLLTKQIQQAHQLATTTKEICINANKILILPYFIVQIIRLRRKARRTFQKTRRPADKTELNRLTAKVRLEINKHQRSKWEEHCSSLNQLKTNDTKLWRAIEAIDSTKPKSFKQPNLMDTDGQLTNNPSTTTNIFADYLAGVFKDSNDPSFDQGNYNYVSREVPNFFTSNEQPIEFTKPTEIYQLIQKEIGTHGAPGQDGITNKALKNLPSCCLVSISNIFNASLELAYVPTAWKLAIVVMIPKPMKDHSKAENHRPISLLITLSKLLERAILKRYLAWLDQINMLANVQCGFRQHRQTKDQILRLLQDGISAFNKEQKLGGLFVDIKQAFDGVWHDGLLFKLNQHKIPNYLGKWTQNYLKDRQFQVRSSNTFSAKRNIETGVPQGSVLGPVLFIIFFNDIVKTSPSPHDPQLALFADDVAAWVASRSLKVIQLRLQKQLDHIEHWMSEWRTQLSTSKTVFTIFNKSNKFIQNQVELKYHNEPIQPVKNFKFLGVTLDPGFKLNKYADELSIRSYRRLNMLRKIKGKNWGASTKLITTTYKVLVRSILEYAPFTLLTMAPANQHKIEKIQRAAARIATFWPPHTSTNTIYSKLNLEPIMDRAYRLTDNYICKANANNPLIHSAIEEYKSSAALDDGAHAKTEPRTTILGILKANKELNCNQILN
jgi:hypothetical protein